MGEIDASRSSQCRSFDGPAAGGRVVRRGTLPERQKGLTYVETVLAVILLAACLVPALQAVGDRTGRQTMLEEIGRQTRCLKEAMERTAIEPYSSLLSAAKSLYSLGSFLEPTIYSLAADTSCPYQRNVYILRYDPVLVDPFTSLSDDMLYVRAEIPNGAGVGTLAVRR